MSVDEFLIKWKEENNTVDAVYSSYHIDAMEAYAKHCCAEQIEIERARRPKTSTNDSALPISDVIERNWFEKLPLHWRYIWYMSGGMVIGFMINYVL